LLKDVETALVRWQTEGSGAVNARESAGHATLLHRAALANTPEIAELLLDANALCDLA
jgi:ankyrin repeat protein